MNDEDNIVTNVEADQSAASLEAGSIVPAREFLTWAETTLDQSAPGLKDGTCGGLNSAELRFLRAVVEHPMQASSEYAKLAGVSPNTLRKIRPALVEKGFIRENRLDRNSRGRTAILLEPLEPARQLVQGQSGEGICAEK